MFSECAIFNNARNVAKNENKYVSLQHRARARTYNNDRTTTQKRHCRQNRRLRNPAHSQRRALLRAFHEHRLLGNGRHSAPRVPSAMDSRSAGAKHREPCGACGALAYTAERARPKMLIVGTDAQYLRHLRRQPRVSAAWRNMAHHFCGAPTPCAVAALRSRKCSAPWWPTVSATP